MADHRRPILRKIAASVVGLTAAVTFTAPAVAATQPPPLVVRKAAARTVQPPRWLARGIAVRCLSSDMLRFTNWTKLAAGITLGDGRQYGLPAGFGRHIDVPTTAKDWTPDSDPNAPAAVWWRAQFTNLRWVTEHGLPQCS